MMKVFKEIRSWIGSIGLSIIIVLVIGIFVFQPYKVEGRSMEPTLKDNQRIYVSKLSNTFSYYPDYGDIVVIDSRVKRKRTIKDDITEHPILQLVMGKKEEHIYFVKRVLGKPGDQLTLDNGRLYRNGELLDEPYLNEEMNPGVGEWFVPEGHIFVMGDNRNYSTDSRDIGSIPLDHVMGIDFFGK
jgi:signal peptidase I